MKFDFKLSMVKVKPSDLNDVSRYDGILYSDFIGSLILHDGTRVYSIEDCPLLWTARSLHRTLTFPIMFGRDTSETLPDKDVTLRGTFHGRSTRIWVVDEGNLVFESSGDSLEMMRDYGRAFSALLSDCFVLAPHVKEHHLFLRHIPDAFALTMLGRD